MTTPIIIRPNTGPKLAPPAARVDLRRFQGIDGLPAALRIETAVGRVMILSGNEVAALCEGLRDIFPEHFE